MTTPIYQASASLEVSGGKNQGVLADPAGDNSASIETEIQKLTSRSLARNVIRELCRSENGQLCRFDGGSIRVDIAGGKAGQFLEFERQPLEAVVGGFLSRLNVSEVGKGTNVVRVSYRHADPTLTRDVVNNLVESYLSRKVVARTMEAGKAVDFIAGQLEDVRTKLDRSEQELQEYKVETA